MSSDNNNQKINNKVIEVSVGVEQQPKPSSVTNNIKMAAQEPKIVRKLLPFAAFLITFATVMTVLIVYMDTTAMRHRQFQLNMTRDYDMGGVEQDNQELILYIREFLIRPAINYSVMGHLNPNANYLPASGHEHKYEITSTTPTPKEEYVTQLLNHKKYGTYIETSAYRHQRQSDTEWLERNLSWSGLLIQTYPKDLFNLLNRGRTRSKCIHACISAEKHPKEISIQSDYDDNVKITSVFASPFGGNEVDDIGVELNQDWFATRVKCFPLFSLILAMNLSQNLDYLDLETHDCNEIHILRTLPLKGLKIRVVSVHVGEHCEGKLFGSYEAQIRGVKDLFLINNYKFMKRIGDDYFFMYKIGGVN